MKGLPFEYAVRNLGRSPARLAMSAGGSMMVVLLVIAAASFISGMQRSLKVSGSPLNTILLGTGSEESVERSEVAMRAAGIAAVGIPGIQRIAGVEAVSPEIHAALSVDVDGRTAMNMLVRGTTPEAFLVHREARVVEGRLPNVGMDEVMVGRIAIDNLGIEGLGANIVIDDRAFEIVGILEADGGVIEGEIWMPLSDLLVVTLRDTLSCIVVRRSDSSMSAIDAFTSTRLDLELTALREDEYFAGLSDFYRPIRIMVIATAVLIAAGGVVGGLNTTYAAFASRIREIGTLRTLGYSKSAIVETLLEESILMSSIGGLVAAIAAWFLLDGLTIQFSMGTFGLSVGPSEIALGLAAGLALGIAGALVPAIRCLRQSIPESLRAAT